MNALYRLLSVLAGLAASLTLVMALFSKDLLDQYTLLAVPQMPLMIGLVFFAVLPAILSILSHSASALTLTATSISALMGLTLAFVAWQELGVLVIVGMALDIAWGFSSAAAGINEAADEFVETDPTPIKRRGRA